MDEMEQTIEKAWPDYSNPPVVETVLGVQFKRMPSLRNVHLGAFWASLGGEWPAVLDAPPLEPQFEVFSEEARWAKDMAIRFSNDLSVRTQMKNAEGDRMIQVQNGRLHLNWLGQEHPRTYPRYAKVREEFSNIVCKFSSFLKSRGLGEMTPDQWEITYVNVIPKGTIWSTPSDWTFFKLLGPLPIINGVANGETFSGEWHFEIPDKIGRLHINWIHGVTKSKATSTDSEFVRLTLTARGKLIGDENSPDRVLSGLDVGHKSIVNSFRELMSSEANRYWGLKNANA
jgi:uncharacterized protein (TIGR04255 family)